VPLLDVLADLMGALQAPGFGDVSQGVNVTVKAIEDLAQPKFLANDYITLPE